MIPDTRTADALLNEFVNELLKAKYTLKVDGLIVESYAILLQEIRKLKRNTIDGICAMVGITTKCSSEEISKFGIIHEPKKLHDLGENDYQKFLTT